MANKVAILCVLWGEMIYTVWLVQSNNQTGGLGGPDREQDKSILGLWIGNRPKYRNRKVNSKLVGRVERVG